MLEAQVLKLTLRKLKNLELAGDIIWYSRLNSGKFKVGNNYVNACDAGTPDIIAVVKCSNNNIVLVFLECKRSGVNVLRYEQQQFFNRMENKVKTICAIINDPTQVIEVIKKAREL